MGVLSSPSERREGGSSPREEPVAARHVWLAWPWASQASARERCRVLAAMTRMLQRASRQRDVRGGAVGLRTQESDDVCDHVRKRGTCSLVCRWSGTGRVWRRVGPPHTLFGGHPPFRGWCKPGGKHTNTNVLVSLGLPKPRGRQSYPG